MFQVIFSLVSLAIVGLVVWRVIAAWRASVGTLWQRALVAGHNSATILWQYVVMASAAFLGNLDKLAAVLNMPEAQSVIQKLPAQPLAVTMIVIAVITVAARLRTL